MLLDGSLIVSRQHLPTHLHTQPSVHSTAQPRTALYNMGEHAISYMERLGEYKAFYESIPTANKPPFLNLTIGGVYRDTPPRKDRRA